MKCKNTILNEMVNNASEIMESRVEMDEMIIGMMKENGDEYSLKTAQILTQQVASAKAAIHTIRERSGCWA